jgi:hypothetical protein
MMEGERKGERERKEEEKEYEKRRLWDFAQIGNHPVTLYAT